MLLLSFKWWKILSYPLIKENVQDGKLSDLYQDYYFYVSEESGWSIWVKCAAATSADLIMGWIKENEGVWQEERKSCVALNYKYILTTSLLKIWDTGDSVHMFMLSRQTWFACQQWPGSYMALSQTTTLWFSLMCKNSPNLPQNVWCQERRVGGLKIEAIQTGNQKFNFSGRIPLEFASA